MASLETQTTNTWVSGWGVNPYDQLALSKRRIRQKECNEVTSFNCTLYRGSILVWQVKRVCGSALRVLLSHFKVIHDA